MKPGICVLCGKPCVDEIAPNEGSYVKFSDYEEPEIFSLDDPTGMEYFCDEHVKAAKALSTFTSKDALAALKKQLGVIPEYKSPRRIGLLKRIFSIMKRS
jgi:hypothetical protein